MSFWSSLLLSLRLLYVLAISRLLSLVCDMVGIHNGVEPSKTITSKIVEAVSAAILIANKPYPTTLLLRWIISDLEPHTHGLLSLRPENMCFQRDAYIFSKRNLTNGF